MKRKFGLTKISSNKNDDDDDDDDDDDYRCLVCGTQYKTGEEWVQCLKCELWSHFACSGHNTHYVCTDCDDDSD
jgi:DNA-directed RNA polymerase subunit RPC12/RpoP